MTTKEALIAKLQSKEARVAILGLGYVGLPLAVVFGDAGFHVIGVDPDARKVQSLNDCVSYIPDVPSEAIERLGGRVKRNDNAPGKPVIEVDLSDARISDAQLRQLRMGELKSLRSLVLDRTFITNEGLDEADGKAREDDAEDDVVAHGFRSGQAPLVASLRTCARSAASWRLDDATVFPFGGMAFSFPRGTIPVFRIVSPPVAKVPQ